MSKTNEVILKVIMDEENYPSEIYWKSDNQQQDWENARHFSCHFLKINRKVL